jgi:FlaA1/EpsC-like NDP-sugar epimerase
MPVSLNRVGAAVAFDAPEFETFEIKHVRRTRAAVTDGVSSTSAPVWTNRRFAATQAIGDGDHVEPLQAVEASLRREQIYRRALAFADALAVLAAVVLTAAFRGEAPGPLMFVAVPLVAILISKIQGLYDRDDMVVQKSTVYEWRALLRTDAMIAVATYLLWLASTAPSAGRGVRLCAMLLGTLFFLSVLSRSTARRIARALTTDERCLVIGAPAQCAGLARRLTQTYGVDFIGVVPDDDVDCSVAGVHELVEQLKAERIVVVPHPAWGERGSVKLVQSAKWLGVRVSLMPTVMAVVGASTTVDEFDSIVLLGVPRFGLSRSSAALKRTLDLTVVA